MRLTAIGLKNIISIMKKRNELKFLLVQIRDNHLVRQEELSSFVKFSVLNKNQIDILNVFDTPSFKANIIDNYDAVFVGGASECPVTDEKNFPFIKYAKELLLYCIKKNIPVFASCYGFQLAVLALGGEIIHVEKDFEMGSIPIKLTNDAKSDYLFKSTPDNFLAISVHQDKAIKTPDNCTTLAYTKDCIHAFKVNNKPFWCFQFHPEVDKDILIERLTHYKDKYTNSDSHLQEIIDSVSDTPESNFLLKKFVDYLISADSNLKTL